jgi:hypothetical protein
MSMGTLTIHHDYESGTTVEGTTRNSLADLALNAHPSWTWSRYAGAWLLRSSRHRQSEPYAIDEIERVLTKQDYTGMWMRMRRVNTKVGDRANPVFPPPRAGEKDATWTVAWHKLAGHRITEQVPPAVVEAYESAGGDRISRPPRTSEVN